MNEQGFSRAGVLQLVSFNLGDEEYGVDILRVQEINRMVHITRVPKAPEFVEGVINLRGKVIPIVDLRKRFGLTAKPHDKNTRIIVVDIDGRTVGLIVDGVSEVLRFSMDTIEPPPPMVTGVDAEYIWGVGKLEDRLLILLDLSKVLANEEKEYLGRSNALAPEMALTAH
ncbi:MAG TPA: chemotaxis protein CheW [Methylomirabilota bacterium]|nr:chemotaxis protein CheW [Methylomirabilota bacterium]